MDGIVRGTQRPPEPRPEPRPTTRTSPDTSHRYRASPNTRMPRNGGVVLGIFLLVVGLAFLRPSVSADRIPSPEGDVVKPATPNSSLPRQLTLGQGGGANESLDDLVILDTPTDTSEPQPETEDPAPDESTIDDSPTNEATPDETPTESDDASKDFTIRILNGGGKSGAAATLRDELVKSEFTISTVGNASTTYDTTMVYYQEGKRAQAEQLSKELGDPAVTLEQNAIAAPTDILVVIGTDRS